MQTPTMKYRLYAAVAIVPLALSISGRTASAQTNTSVTATAEENSSYVLDSVTVTASKREENILDAAYSVSALEGDALEEAGATEYRDFLTTVPGVSLVEAGLGVNNVIIRGLATTSGGTNLSGTVVTYFDEIALNGGIRAIEVEPVDIERIEVLRGPQGTYYGAGSLGGTLRIIPNKPKLDVFESDLSASVSTTDGADDLNTNFTGTVNLPLVEGKAALRGSFYQRDEAGYVRNLQTGELVGGGTVKGGRLAFLAEPTDRLDIHLQFVNESTEADGFRVREPYHGAGNAVRRRGDEVDDTEFRLYNINLGYDFDNVRFDSVTGYYETDYYGRSDASLYDGNVIALAGPPALYGLESYDIYSDDGVKSDVFSQEFRLTSETSSAIQWILGAYYRKEDSDRASVFVEEALLGPVVTINRTRKSTQWSGFGELNIDLDGPWGIDLGLRYSDYEQDVTVDSEAGTQAETVWTPKINLRFEPTEDQLYYFQISKGFRLGGFNGGPPDLPGINIPNVEQYYSYASDKLWNYEAGTKLVLAGGRANLSGAVYYADWTDIPIFLTLAGGAYNPLVNVGNATSKGVEAEFSSRLTENFTVSLSGSLMETELEGNVQYQQQRLPASPETMVNAAFAYERPLSAEWDFYANGNANYVGSYRTLLIEEFQDNVAANDLDTRFGVTEDKDVGGYTLVNMNIGVRRKGWDWSLFARNLLDADDATLNNTFSYAGAPAESFVAPRTIGLKLRTSF